MDTISKRYVARLTDMWTLLLWEGELRNARLQKVFDVTPVQCSRLIALFRQQFPNAVSPITNERCWPLRDHSGAPEGSGHMVEYLRLAGDPTGSIAPWLVDARTEQLRIRPEFVSAIRSACLANTGVRVRYSSMSNPDGKSRNLFPHAVVRLSHRWHMRAWCEDRQQFRDFNLGRVLELKSLADSASKRSADDLLWNRYVDLILRPHQALTDEQSRVIRREYFKGTVQSRLHIRAALVQYTIQEFRAAMEPARETPPAFQLEVGNADDVRQYVFARDP